MSSSQSRPLSPQPPSPDLTTIAAVLTEAAQAIQSFSDKKPPQRDDTTSPILSGETRCYHLSAATLKRERDLLKRYRADDFQGLLVEAHTLLAGLQTHEKHAPRCTITGAFRFQPWFFAGASLVSTVENVQRLRQHGADIFINRLSSIINCPQTETR